MVSSYHTPNSHMIPDIIKKLQEYYTNLSRLTAGASTTAFPSAYLWGSGQTAGASYLEGAPKGHG
eukprot:13413220-Ditylum_brightwellii.AAC.1